MSKVSALHCCWHRVGITIKMRPQSFSFLFLTILPPKTTVWRILFQSMVPPCSGTGTLTAVSVELPSVRACYHNCTTFTKPIQLSKKEFVLAFYVLRLSTNEKSSHRAAEGRKWKNKFRKSVGAVVFNQTCASIYNLSMPRALICLIVCL